MSRRLVIALLLVCLAGCAHVGGAPESAPTTVLRELADRYWQNLLQHDLELKLRHGIPIEALPDPSFEFAQRQADFAGSLLRRLDQIEEEALSHEDWLTWATLDSTLRDQVAELPCFWYSSPATPYSTPIYSVHRAFTTHRFANAADLARYRRLLEQYPAFIDRIAAVVEQQQNRGIYLPDAEIDLVVPMLAALRKPAAESVLWVSDERLVQIDPAATDALRGDVETAVNARINPAIERLVNVFSDAYRAKAPAAVGMANQPGGTECYRQFVRSRTTLDLTPEEVHRIGLSEVEKIRGQMAEVRGRLGFRGSHAEFHQMLRNDPGFYAKTPEEVGRRLTEPIRKVEPSIPQLFGPRPRAPYDVQRLDPAREAGMTFGYYQTPTATDPVGHYYYNGSKLSERNLIFATALMLHELVPGHHFQIALQSENTSLPRFRRETFHTAFVEGWGEYGSALGFELGVYDDPYDHYGRLLMDLMLSVRLVVDTGMNHLGWSRERAMEYMRENLLLSETEIATETLRYSVDIPAQALAYKIGSRKIAELRQRAEQALGPRFDVQAFHDAVLGSGSMPLSILERHIDHFIRQQRASPPPLRPEPAEDPGGEQAVNQSVERLLHRQAPGAVVPDRALPECHRISEECGGAGEPEDLQVLRPGRQRASGDVRGEDRDHHAVDEPERQALGHRKGPVRQHGHHHHRPLLELLGEFRSLHLRHACRARHHVVPGRDRERPQRIHHLVLIRNGGKVFLVPQREHVNDRAGDEHQDRREEDGEPERGQGRHDNLL